MLDKGAEHIPLNLLVWSESLGYGLFGNAGVVYQQF